MLKSTKAGTISRVPIASPTTPMPIPTDFFKRRLPRPIGQVRDRRSRIPPLYWRKTCGERVYTNRGGFNKQNSPSATKEWRQWKGFVSIAHFKGHPRFGLGAGNFAASARGRHRVGLHVRAHRAGLHDGL